MNMNYEYEYVIDHESVDDYHELWILIPHADDESLHNQPALGGSLINSYQFYPPDDPGGLLKDDLNPSGVSGALGEASEDDLGHMARCDGAQELDAFEGRSGSRAYFSQLEVGVVSCFQWIMWICMKLWCLQ